MDMNLIRLVLSASVLISSATCEKCSPPAQQGSNYTVSHSGDVSEFPDYGLQWVVGQFSECQCYSRTMTCTTTCADGIQATIESTQPGLYRSQMTVLGSKVTRQLNGVSMKWFISVDRQWSCDLEVYDYRSSPSCNQSVTNTGSADNPNIWVTVDCQIDNVFPQPRCQFHQSRNGQTQVPIPSQYVTEHDVTSDASGDVTYNRRCTMTRPVTDLEPGQYTFEVNMYPGGITDGIDYGKAAVTHPINLDDQRNATTTVDTSTISLGPSTTGQADDSKSPDHTDAIVAGVLAFVVLVGIIVVVVVVVAKKRRNAPTGDKKGRGLYGITEFTNAGSTNMEMKNFE